MELSPEDRELVRKSGLTVEEIPHDQIPYGIKRSQRASEKYFGDDCGDTGAECADFSDEERRAMTLGRKLSQAALKRARMAS